MDTVTSTHEKAVLRSPAAAVAVDNFQGRPRSADEPLPTQGGSETMALLSSGVMPYRKNTTPTAHAEAMPTVTSDQIPGMLTAAVTAAGRVQCNGSIDEAKCCVHPVDRPLGTVGSAITPGMLFSGWYKQNGSTGTETAAHPLTDPLGTLTARDTTAILTTNVAANVAAEWRAALAELKLEDCYFRMMGSSEIGRGCGFDVDHPNRPGKGTFIVWGTAREQVDGYGNAVTPAIGEWIGGRLLPIVHPGEAVR